MGSRHILKLLANGWEVPYPDEAIHKDMLLLKDYRLNGFPKDTGPELFYTDSYMEWLQDYLIHCETTLTEEQCKILNHMETDKYIDCGTIGWLAGFYESAHALAPEYNYPADFEDTLKIDDLTASTCADPYADLLRGYDVEIFGPAPTRLEFILEDYGWLLLRKSEAIQFQTYWPGFHKLEPLHWLLFVPANYLEPLDSAWRVYLSEILKRMQNKDDRINGLHKFFDQYVDMIRK